jgi:AhpC/TSA family
MIRTLFLGALAAFALMGAMPAQAALEIGKPTPDFTAKDSNGQAHKLSDFKGKIVVLEWNNPECPFVKKHYDSGNMQKLQQTYTAKDVVWLTINSSAAGKQGHLDNAGANKYIAEKDAKQTAYLLDPAGEIGKIYDAKTTPHMFVIFKDGTLAYEGAIDDNDSANPDDAATAKNHVAAALDDLIAGAAVKTAQTKPYGCGVKY